MECEVVGWSARWLSGVRDGWVEREVVGWRVRWLVVECEVVGLSARWLVVEQRMFSS